MRKQQYSKKSVDDVELLQKITTGSFSHIDLPDSFSKCDLVCLAVMGDSGFEMLDRVCLSHQIAPDFIAEILKGRDDIEQIYVVPLKKNDWVPLVEEFTVSVKTRFSADSHKHRTPTPEEDTQ